MDAVNCLVINRIYMDTTKKKYFLKMYVFRLRDGMDESIKLLLQTLSKKFF